MRAWHVLEERRIAAATREACVRGDATAFEEDFDGGAVKRASMDSSIS
jgi:hypothetical protein